MKVMRRVGVVDSHIDGRLVALNSDLEFVELDVMGEFIWSQTATPTDTDRIVQAVTAQFEVDVATCREDVIRFLHELHSAHVIDLS